MEEDLVILMTLDSIYDTRLATLASISPVIANIALAEDYLNRRIDRFSLVEDAYFREVYDRRGLEILAEAPPTDIVTPLNLLLLSLRKEMEEMRHKSSFVVRVNTYPYPMDKLPLGSIQEFLTTAINNKAKIDFIYEEHLTSSYMLGKVSYIFDYDGALWLNRLLSEEGRVGLGEVNLILPGIVSVKLKEDRYNKVLRGITDTAKVMIDLEFIPVKHFSMMNIKKEN